MYNHHNFPKTLVMTLFNNLKLTTAADSIYTAKADFYFCMHILQYCLCANFFNLFSDSHRTSFANTSLSHFPLWPFWSLPKASVCLKKGLAQLSNSARPYSDSEFREPVAVNHANRTQSLAIGTQAITAAFLLAFHSALRTGMSLHFCLKNTKAIIVIAIKWEKFRQFLRLLTNFILIQ